ncbi:Protein of unknown function [Bacillus mycoides]|nr:Protein of unknown function [Bacillus mycoides]
MIQLKIARFDRNDARIWPSRLQYYHIILDM